MALFALIVIVLAVGLMVISKGRGHIVAASDHVIELDLNAVTEPVSPRLSGVNVTVWDGGLARAARVDQLAAAGMRTLRYPGGSMSDAYHWADNQVEGRSHHEPSPTTVFANLNEALGGTAYVTVNYGSGTAEEAAAWVAWANGATDSQQPIGVDVRGTDWKTVGDWARLRAAAPLATDDGRNFLRAGHPEPYRWRYFEVGNEIYGSWAHDRHGQAGSGLPGQALHPRSYARNAARFIERMKAVDPEIRVGVISYHGEPYDKRDADDRCLAVCDSESAVVDANGRAREGWNPIVLHTLSELGRRPDFLVMHVYPQLPGREDDAYLLSSAPQLKAHAAELRRQIADWWQGTEGERIEIALTEYNSVTGGPGKQSVSIVNALFYADSFGQLMSSEVDAAHWWLLTASIDIGGHNPSRLHGTRDYGSYAWLSDGATVKGRAAPPADAPFPTYQVARQLAEFHATGVQLLSVQTNVPDLSVYATRDVGGTVRLLVINKSAYQQRMPEIRLTGGGGGAYSLSVSHYGLAQEASGQGAVSRDEGTRGERFEFAFEPYSVNLLRLRAVSAN